MPAAIEPMKATPGRHVRRAATTGSSRSSGTACAPSPSSTTKRCGCNRAAAIAASASIPELAVIPHQLAARAGDSRWRDRRARRQGRLALPPDSAAHRQHRPQLHRAPGALHAGGLLRLRPALSRWLRSARRALERAPRTAAAGGDARRRRCASPKPSPAPARRCWRRRARTGLEGMLAKHASSRYESRRSREWLKIKIVNEQEFVIGGFTEPQGDRDLFRRAGAGRVRRRQAALGGQRRHRLRPETAGQPVSPS